MTPSESGREVMDLRAVREYLGVSESTIRELLARRRIPAAKVGRIWRFRRSEIDEWLSRGGTDHSIPDASH